MSPQNVAATANNFHREARLTCLGNARACLQWMRIHAAAGERNELRKVTATFRNYCAAARNLSRDQKRMDAAWARIAARS